jgi:hypothetical protein
VAKQDVTVEMFYDSAWNTVTAYARQPITIARGRAPGTTEPEAGTATLTLDNRTGDYDPSLPTAALYGLAGRNTPTRVTVGGHVRHVGEAARFQPDETVDFAASGGDQGDRWVGLESAGVLRRLTQGDDPLPSALLSSVRDTANLVAYWPLESGPFTTKAPSGILGGHPMEVRVGTIAFTESGPPGTAGAVEPVLQYDSTLAGPVVNGSATNWQVGFWFRGLPTDVTEYAYVVALNVYTSSTLWQAFVQHEATDNDVVWQAWVPGTESIGVASLGGDVADGGGIMDGEWHLIQLAVEQDGADCNVYLNIDDSEVNSVVMTSRQIGRPYLIRATGRREDEGVTSVANNVATVGISSVTLHNQLTKVAMYEPGIGYTGETAGRRIERLCDERGVAFTSSGDLDATAPMGPQRPDRFVALLAECEATDGGILSDERTAVGLHYRTLDDLYNQTAALTLDYSGEQIAPGLAPVLDDLGVHNDITASRRDGGSYRVEKTSGSLNVNDPADDPEGVGRYPHQLSVNPVSDDALPLNAGWALNLGTHDEPRWPTVTVDLDAAPDLADDVNALNPGDLVEITNMRPDTVRLMVRRIEETVGTHRRLVTLSCDPAGPYDVAVEGDDELGRLDSAYSTTASSFTAGASTSLSVAVDTASGGLLWRTGSGTTVSYVGVATDDSGTGTQTEFDPGWPAGYTPTDGDDGILFLHFGGNSLTATDPTDWTDWPGVTNPITEGTASRAYAWYRRITSADSAPTITVSGSATGVATLVIVSGGATAGGGAQIGQNSSDTASGTTIDLPTLTGVLEGSMVVAFVSARVPSGTAIPSGITPDADYTERSDVATSRNTGTSQNVRTSANTRAVSADATLSGDTFTTDQTSSLIAFAVEVLADGGSATFPFDIKVAGVRLTVDAISGASSPQTFTVTQTPVNGVTKTIPSGSQVRLWSPARAAK